LPESSAGYTCEVPAVIEDAVPAPWQEKAEFISAGPICPVRQPFRAGQGGIPDTNPGFRARPGFVSGHRRPVHPAL